MGVAYAMPFGVRVPRGIFSLSDPVLLCYYGTAPPRTVIIFCRQNPGLQNKHPEIRTDGPQGKKRFRYPLTYKTQQTTEPLAQTQTVFCVRFIRASTVLVLPQRPVSDSRSNFKKGQELVYIQDTHRAVTFHLTVQRYETPFSVQQPHRPLQIIQPQNRLKSFLS